MLLKSYSKLLRVKVNLHYSCILGIANEKRFFDDDRVLPCRSKQEKALRLYEKWGEQISTNVQSKPEFICCVLSQLWRPLFKNDRLMSVESKWTYWMIEAMRFPKYISAFV